MRIWAVVVWSLLLSAPDLRTTVLAADGNRVALVIGNGKYVHAPTLTNPASDARLMAETLRKAGFKVVEGIDLDYLGMNDRLNRFTEASYDAELAVIYYAGHGMQVNGKNYLIPVDSELKAPAHLRTRTIQIDELLAALPPDPGVGVVILDACRDNPLARTIATSLPKSRSTAAPGLAPVEIASTDIGTGGVLIAYATDPGAVSYDGTGANSPYTTSLAKHLAEPGVNIQSALTRVRGEVTAETNGRQRPWYNASLGREVFIGPATAETAAAPAHAPTSSSANQSTEPDSRGWEVEQRVWDESSKRNTVAHYEAYLQQFPSGSFAALARLNLNQLKKTPPVVAEVVNDASRFGTAAESSAATADRDNEAGTELTESAIGLDRQKKVDLQERLLAIGYDLGDADGTFGAVTRRAIGLWQKENGLSSTTFLTPNQYVRLKLDSDLAVKGYRAQRASEKQKSATSLKTHNSAPVVRAKPEREQRRQAVKPQPAAKSKAVSQAPAARQPKFRTCRTTHGVFQVPASKKCPLTGPAPQWQN